MRKVKVEDAVGMVLCHDITRIVPGEFKGPAFKKGHVVKEEDIPELLKLGKDHLYIWECGSDLLHENDAALRIAKASMGQGVDYAEPVEGKVTIKAARDGLLKIDVEGLCQVNEIDQISFSTRHTNQVVAKGETLAGTRVIPLVIKNDQIEAVEEICRSRGPLLEVKEMQKFKVGLITTGNEVYYGRIQDKFGPVVKEKLSRFGCRVLWHVMLPDDAAQIKDQILNLRDQGAQMIITTGGMSVDPDDVTPNGVKSTGAELVTYGSPVLPGAMFLLAYLDDIPIMGLPACVMFFKATVFDLMLPRVLAGERITKRDIAMTGHGGLCMNCQECRYPMCPFGK
ncbi:molybdopterin-binding protein [Desulfoscipio gibsoniae]|uniref:Molybdopterin molybdenumtransferase n=1 Tax=Desulfoscipio gibsoniae DSM 7213 TaxID=767817 RepID=R4KJ50_9FIRM|nr:molybdopterin-binding protein [Desulfoscipio gibsoniae]AGL03248.1 molybdopterin biosynthesis enzyme [Desulfoscipio gibsoniae DSM 7213]